MKAVFVHDHKFRVFKGNYYTPGGLSDKVLERYTDTFGNLTVVSRILKTDTSDGFIPIQNKHITFIKSSIGNIKKVIKDADYIILRVPSINALIAMYYAKKYKKKVLVEVVACTWDSVWFHSIKGKILALPYTILTKTLIYYSDYVLYVTDKFLQERYPTRGKQVSCSDVVLANQSDIKNILFNRERKIRDYMKRDRIVLVSVGTIDSKVKAQERVIKALNYFKKSDNLKYEYWLIGGGSNERLMKWIIKYGLEDNVKMFGALPQNEVINKLKKADIFIQPSKTEGLPRALIEAMSIGMPSIGSKAGGIKELLNENYLFSNSIIAPKNLVGILKGLTEEKLRLASTENYLKSKEYNYMLLERKRREFFNAYKLDVEKKRG
ncbi:glycosyltransferase [Vagococcus lutrae]|uniref:glycosyltransferase n=1 Tax=Vagococcus lutrae TaxID=81947 RepID=UPI002A841AA8|nr:glycosyltransferase [Vagococcus lutrae]MDY3706233.1 glycosyltransferase [Vagococcus lutrae]